MLYSTLVFKEKWENSDVTLKPIMPQNIHIELLITQPLNITIQEKENYRQNELGINTAC